MMPFNIAEITRLHLGPWFLQEKDPIKRVKTFEQQITHPITAQISETYGHLYQYGPFPEPFLRQNERFSRKWHQDYFSLVIRQDLKDISKVSELDKIEHLLFLIPSRIMSPLSMANLARELEVAHTTVKSWLEQLKRLYLLFPVEPWAKKISRSLKKEKKWYFLDWYYAPEGAARLENMVATYLFRACLALTDMGYGKYQLFYTRTLEKKEIDFVVALDNQPILALEVKTGDAQLSAALKTRQTWFPSRPTLGIQVVEKRKILQKYSKDTWIISAERFLSILP